jgi:hypothetical protein
VNTPDFDGDGLLARADCRLILQAVRSRWPIPEETRQRLILRLGQTILAGNDRQRASARLALDAIQSPVTSNTKGN